MVQAAAIKARITAEHGETVDIGGRMVRAFPNPAKLAQLSTINGLSETKLQRLRGIAEAALGGTLGAARLRSLPRSEALEELIALPGIGPFSAELILSVAWCSGLHAHRRATARSSYGDRLRLEGIAQRRRYRPDQRGLEALPHVGRAPPPASCSKTRLANAGQIISRTPGL